MSFCVPSSCLSFLVLFLLLLCIELSTCVVLAARPLDFSPPFGYEPTLNSFSYTICNGLSNQILYHAVSLAVALQYEKEIIFVPNHFIVDGTQHSDEPVLPNAKNSIPFAQAFDADHFVATIQTLALANHNNNKEDENDNDKDNDTLSVVPRIVFQTQGRNPNADTQAKCPTMGDLTKGDPLLIQQIIEQAFRPSVQLQLVVDEIQSKFPTTRQGGMCVHHRDGPDWHEHCTRWNEMTKGDGVFRQNCLGQEKETFLQSLQTRGLNSDPNNNNNNNNNKTETNNWIYYCGDHEPPKELSSVATVFRKDEMSLKSMNPKTLQILPESSSSSSSSLTNSGSSGDIHHHHQHFNKVIKPPTWLVHPKRDISALIDFFVCRTIDKFVGNSVSTFSALQIALRHGHDAYWYNSQSIPLATLWDTYVIPIVYTYTEQSKASGKFLLQTSINSVRRHMAANTPIHILYHGTQDKAFIKWLQSRNVIIHVHNPTWKDQIETMRQNGDPLRSNLFLHAGNYLGTWQRIDIPLFLNTEYALLLDVDTILTQPITFADFGLNLTKSIAMSAEVDLNDKRPWNAGIMLLNIPNLRKTHTDFLNYILSPIHIETAEFENGAPSDQGAYLGFYEDTVSFLDIRFNFKPYWNSPEHLSDDAFEQSRIIHLHGPKPHDYIKYITLGVPCDGAIDFLCRDVGNMPYLCPTIQAFATNTESNEEYCQSFLTNQTEIDTCFETLSSMDASSRTTATTTTTSKGGKQKTSSCEYFDSLVETRVKEQGFRTKQEEKQQGEMRQNDAYYAALRQVKEQQLQRETNKKYYDGERFNGEYDDEYDDDDYYYDILNLPALDMGPFSYMALFVLVGTGNLFRKRRKNRSMQKASQAKNSSSNIRCLLIPCSSPDYKIEFVMRYN